MTTQAATDFQLDEDAPPVAIERSADDIKCALESLIFVADGPVTEKQLARSARTTIAQARPLLEALVTEYEGRGVELQVVAGGYQFRSAAVSAPYVRSFISPPAVRLSRAQLEALSIVAYRQPVTRPEIDDIRGVDSGSALRVLAERGLLKILGRKDEPGRPLLYGTTPRFLEFFGLSSLRELPTLQEFSELSDEHKNLFEDRMGEELDFDTVEREASEVEAQAQEELLQQELAPREDDEEEDDEE